MIPNGFFKTDIEWRQRRVWCSSATLKLLMSRFGVGAGAGGGGPVLAFGMPVHIDESMALGEVEVGDALGRIWSLAHDAKAVRE